MTTVTVTGLELTKKGIAKLRRDLSKTHVLSNRMGRALRDDARRRITTQGDGQWEPLSKWTMARTGRKKALIKERAGITFKLVGAQLIVGHESGEAWDLGQHERGFTTPPDVPATIKLKRPRLLGISTKEIHIRRARPSETPARRVFANEAETNKLLEPIVKQWVKEVIDRSRKVT